MRGAVCVLLFLLCLSGTKGNYCPLSSQPLTRNATDAWQDLKSPNYNSTYNNNLECEWTIQSLDSQRKIVLITVDMDLEETGDSCADFIQVFDGNISMGKYCNRSAIPVITSSGPSLRVEFTSDSSIAGRGFFLQYRLVPFTISIENSEDNHTCLATGTVLEAEDTLQFIRSPNYPHNYPPHTDCVWKIRASTPGRVVKIVVIDSSLESSPSCSYDYVAAYDGYAVNVSQLDKWCGNQKPTVYSTAAYLSLHFHSDQSNQQRGFFISFQEIPASEVPWSEVPIQACSSYGITVNAQTTRHYILSPNYPAPYPAEANCMWTIRTSTFGHVVKIVVLESSLESSASCSYDYVAAVDGYGVDGTQLDKWCGSETPTVYSTGSALTLNFRSDQSNQLQGFRIAFQEVPASAVPTTALPTLTCDAVGERVEAESWPQYILSPNYPSIYPPNANCVWKIRAPTYGHVVKIVVIDSSLESSSPCSYDYVAAYDGYGVYGTLLDTWCGIETPTVYSTGQYLTLKFHSDRSNQQRGFKISFQAVPASEVHLHTCSASGVSVEAGLQPQYIMSPNYPLSYPASTDCQWTVHAPAVGYVVKIAVLDSSLESSSSCSYDYVTAYDAMGTWSSLDTWCGSETPTVYSSGSYLTLTFHSDGSRQFRGFNISFQEVPESERPTSLPASAIIGIVIGVCVFLIFCSVGCWYLVRKSRQSTADAVTTSWNARNTATRPHQTYRTAGNQLFFTTTSYSPGTLQMSSDPFSPPPYPGPAQHNAPHPPTSTSGGPDWSRQQSLPSEPPPPYSLASLYQVQPGKQTGETTPGHVAVPEVPGGAAAPGSGQPAPGGSDNRGFVPDQV